MTLQIILAIGLLTAGLVVSVAGDPCFAAIVLLASLIIAKADRLFTWRRQPKTPESQDAD